MSKTVVGPTQIDGQVKQIKKVLLYWTKVINNGKNLKKEWIAIIPNVS